jgi:hypothetical protein
MMIPPRAAFGLALLLCLGANTPAFSADAAGNYAIWGLGQSSCHKFNKAVEQGETRQYKDYLMGYLTAFNTLSENTYNIAGTTKLNEIEASIANYCAQHQIESFNRAIQQFATENFDSRFTVPPGSGQGWGAKSTK